MNRSSWSTVPLIFWLVIVLLRLLRIISEGTTAAKVTLYKHIVLDGSHWPWFIHRSRNTRAQSPNEVFCRVNDPTVRTGLTHSSRSLMSIQPCVNHHSTPCCAVVHGPPPNVGGTLWPSPLPSSLSPSAVFSYLIRWSAWKFVSEYKTHNFAQIRLIDGFSFLSKLMTRAILHDRLTQFILYLVVLYFIENLNEIAFSIQFYI